MKCFDGRLDYNPDTGVFTWVVAPRGRSAGSVAGGSKSNGYVRIKIDGKMYQAHRLAWDTLHPDDLLGPDDEIDHIDHDKTNNRGGNLRKVTTQQNMQNKSLYACNKTGATGVEFLRKEGIWRARIRVKTILMGLGRFKTFEEALSVRKAAEIEYGFHTNHGVNHG